MATIYGVVQHVIGRSGAVIEMYGNATFDFVSNSGSMAIIRGVSRTAVVNGRGNMIKFYCDYGTIESSGNRILMNKGAGLTLHGIDNEINPSAQSRVSIWETGNHVNFNSSDSLVQIETENLKTFFHGSGGNIEFRKTGQEIESSGNNIKNWLSGYSQKITGDGNIIVPNWRSETILHGNNNTIDATGRPSHLFVSLKLTAPNSSVTVKGDGITIDALASGQNISLHGNGDWVTSNGNTLNMLADGLLVNVTGDANTINARGSSATNLHGTDNTVNPQNDSGALVSVHQNGASATINGKGATVGINANDTTIHANGDIIRFSKSGLKANVTGDSNVILAEHTTLHLAGANNTVGGKGNVIYAAPHSTVFVDSPDTIVNGSNLTIVIGKGVKGSSITINGDHNEHMTEGNWPTEVWHLTVYSNGDYNYFGRIGVGALKITGNAHSQSHLHHTGDTNYGAIGAPLLIFPSYTPPQTSEISLPTWGGAIYNYSQVYNPINTLPANFGSGWATVTVGAAYPEGTLDPYPWGSTTYYYPPGETKPSYSIEGPRSLEVTTQKESVEIAQNSSDALQNTGLRLAYSDVLEGEGEQQAKLAFGRLMDNLAKKAEPVEGRGEPVPEQAVEASLKDLSEGPRSVESESAAKGVESATGATAPNVDLAALDQLRQIDTSQH